MPIGHEPTLLGDGVFQVLNITKQIGKVLYSYMLITVIINKYFKLKLEILMICSVVNDMCSILYTIVLTCVILYNEKLAPFVDSGERSGFNSYQPVDKGRDGPWPTSTYNACPQ